MNATGTVGDAGYLVTRGWLDEDARAGVPRDRYGHARHRQPGRIHDGDGDQGLAEAVGGGRRVADRHGRCGGRDGGRGRGRKDHHRGGGDGEGVGGVGGGDGHRLGGEVGDGELGLARRIGHRGRRSARAAQVGGGARGREG